MYDKTFIFLYIYIYVYYPYMCGVRVYVPNLCGIILRITPVVLMNKSCAG